MQRLVAIFIFAWIVMAGVEHRVEGEVKQAAVTREEPIQPIPLHIVLDERKVVLGHKLFEDVRLSKGNTLSCSTCHHLETNGTDNKVRSIGLGGAEGAINTPTVFNAGFNFRQFWDGRALNLEEQIDGPLHHPKEMGSNWVEVIGKLKRNPAYVAAFNAIYPPGIAEQTVKDAIAVFIRSLYTPNSRFDRYLRLENDAITAEEKEGYRLFKAVGCIACHQGIGIGGNMFQVFGVMRNYFADRGNVTEADYGRYNLTGRDRDRHVFKVPSLRNVEVTPPYLHDGSVNELEAIVDVMAKYQLGRKLNRKQVILITKFLKTLTGEYKGKRLKLLKKIVQVK